MCVSDTNRDDATRGLPKRVREATLHLHDPEELWGIQVQHSFSAAGFLCYCLLSFLGPFAFWCWWQHKYPTDLQNASVPLGMVIALEAFLLGILVYSDGTKRRSKTE